MSYTQFRYDGPMSVEHRQDWMDKVTNDKFAAWDRAVRNNSMLHGSPEEKAEVFVMLKDPTIYMYAWFRDEKGKPFRMFSYQDIILNDPNKRIIFAASNQIGKSISLCVKALTYALTHPGTTTLMVSKTLPQAKDLLRRIKMFLNNSSVSFESDVGDTDTKTEIYFKHFDILHNGAQHKLNDSRIICVPATEAALGYAANLILVDELAFYEDGEYFFEQIIEPRTYATDGQIIVFSNPNGQQGIFWKLWNNKRFSKYRFNYLDMPGHTQEGFDAASDDKSRAQVDSTLLAVFTSAEGGFLTLEERKAMQEERPNVLPLVPTKQFVVFFDFAKVHDHTVRAIASLTDDGKGIYVHEIKEYAQGTPYSNIVEDLEQLIQQYSPTLFSMIGWDNTGVGSGIEDFIKRIQFSGVHCIPVPFSLDNKSRMYTILKMLIEKNLQRDEHGVRKVGISLPFTRNGDQQFAMLRFKRNNSGKLMVHHENENDLDDIPDCCAGLAGLMIHPDYFPSSVTIVNPDKGRLCFKCGKEMEMLEKCPGCGELYDDSLGVV